jgi:amino acid adenylation domain-containing protein
MNVATASAEFFEFTCSFAQQRVWIDDRLAPGSGSYNIHASLLLPSAIQPALLERALRDLVTRHESLRTTFVERDGIPYQRVARAGTSDFAAADLRALATAEREQRILELGRAQATQPFDLDTGPLLRVRLLRVGAVESVLMLTVHHIVADAWSMSVLLRDLTELYGATATGRPPALPELPIQYADYATWQRHPTDTSQIDASLAYWRKQLAGVSALDLPVDRPRPAAASHRGRTLHFTFDDVLSHAVLRVARTQSMTPFAVLLAALAIVLQRNAGQDEIVVGAPVAGRERAELEGLIGFFVNTLVLRLDLSGEPSFAILAARVQRTLQAALEQQSVPFERLVEELRPPRDLSRNPFFQVSAQYLAAPLAAGTMQGPAAKVLDVQRGAANFDLSFDFWRSGDCLMGRVDYATDLFGELTVQRWLGQLQRVLAQAVARPDASIEACDLLSEQERRQILVEWAGASHPYPRESTIVEQLATIARRNPDAPAVRAPGCQWSYTELHARAEQYARHLAGHGARAGDFIGLALARGPEQVVAVIGILRIGATYVALDPEWPAERLALCIRAAGIERVVCSVEQDARFADLGVERLHDADPRRAVERFHDEDRNPASERVTIAVPTDPLAPAYVAFTSGSTGEPKGVIVPHRAVLRLVCGNPDVPLSADDSMLVYAPITFDASTLELWGALCNGACLSIPPPGPLGLDEISRWIDREHITVAWLTAGLFHQLAAAHPTVLARVRRLYSGGDVLGGDAVRRVLAAGDGRACVLNGYGPTENTTFTCVHAMRRPEDVPTPVPIGRPVANSYVRVLDARGRPTPVGVAGELLAGGDGVALGYLGSPEATARSFVPDPIDVDRGRVYRTGDRVRWRADGTLEFLGRVDRQVKVRGHRVEPGEIESILRTLPDVSDAHVLARADASGDKHLVAYVAAPATVTTVEILRQLAARLPQWMIPTDVHVRPELLLGSTGKIDTAALTDEPSIPAVGASTDTALDGEIEALVADVWQDVLCRPVGRESNFFTDLGGHSLLATQAVSRLNAALEIELPLAAIFEEPTPRRLAPRIEALLLADMETREP